MIRCICDEYDTDTVDLMCKNCTEEREVYKKIAFGGLSYGYF